ncbi:unnamed protein product [Menidia menidia]|uniref:(Atlantic silverside) hypothetical protein n=1 Tax=Menidia menidia TaxID=238744 RepID=A0A8S4B6T0_9TELE|nr:unnamed protein product [Menidia menidia]
MSGNAFLVLALIVALLVLGSSPDPAAAAETQVLHRLLAKREKARDPAGPETRAERRAHLSEDEREMMTKQIVQAISEVMNSGCVSDRDYQGWVDFGRRDVD